MLSALRIRPVDRPRAGPDAGRHAERGQQAGRVPVVERRLQPANQVVGVKRRRKHLDQQRIAADHRRRRRDRAEQRRPALGDDPGHRDRRSERCQVTRAFGWPRSTSCRAAPTRRSMRTSAPPARRTAAASPRPTRVPGHRTRDRHRERRRRPARRAISTHVLGPRSVPPAVRNATSTKPRGEDGSEQPRRWSCPAGEAAGAVRVVRVRRGALGRRGD